MSDISAALAKKPNETAVFAAGCFWCIQPPYDNAEGVEKTTVGFTGGITRNPTYKEVTGENTGHYEAIEVVYDPSTISYDQILDIFWHNIDPTDAGGQFFDRGQSYQTVVFYANEAQHQAALASKQKMEEQLGKKIATKILPLDHFYPAEEYHQEYYKKNKLHYEMYKQGSGRKERLKDVWGKKSG